MGYINPLLKLPAGKALMALPADQRKALEPLLRQLRDQANVEAENSWRRRKGPMAAYWRAVATYARHVAHALSKGASPDAEQRADEPMGRADCQHGIPMQTACFECERDEEFELT